MAAYADRCSMNVRGVYHVWARALWLPIDAVKMGGIDVRRAFEGLSVDEATVRRQRYVDWDDYAQISDRLWELGGAGQEAEALLENSYPLLIPEFRPLARAFVSPMSFVRLLHEVALPAMFSALVFSQQQLGPDRIGLSIRLRPGARPSYGFFRGTFGGLRAYPKHLGLPPAVVTGDVSATHGDYDVRLPASRTIPARLRHLITQKLALDIVVGREDDGSLLSATFVQGGVQDVECRLTAAASRWELTPRQLEILRSVAVGATNKEIAKAAQCAENTVELHVTQLLLKARVTSRAQLIARFWCER